MRAPLVRAGLLVLACLAAAGRAKAVEGPSPPLRDGFEDDRTSWRQEETDVTVRLQAHDRSDRAAHGGLRSEHFRFTAQAGSAFYYSYRVGKVPVTPDLKASLFCRSA